MSQEHISDYYTHDHDELDANFKSFQDLKTVDFPLAKEHFKKFMFGLKQHIKWEEEILFPLFDAKTGMKDCGPTMVMRAEHQQILEAMEALHNKVRLKDIQSSDEERLLLDFLRMHNDKEEQIVYPAIDQMTSDAEKKTVFTEMRKDLETGPCCGGCSCL